ncbi:uncharacterized protein LOC134828659 [Culicoides brevitarsis]|uniref:uncharacterized protein LOC134828659 n=1 Tax=Culicoides brevitarsis TaxID=469753 RepID=UPI00307B9959
MHYLTVILVLFSVVAHKVLTQKTNEDLETLKQLDPEYGETWMFFPDGEGNPQIAYLKYPNTTSSDKGKYMGRDGMGMKSDAEGGNGEIYYFLYRKNFVNKPKMFKMNDGSYKSVLADDKNYDPSKDTKIVIHGWKNTYKSNVGQMVKNSYLAKSDYNVIVVDWSSMAEDNFYVGSAQSTRKVGFTTANLVDYLVTERSTKLDNVHIIGHSLGAQTAGFTGMNVKSGKVGRITGLDPAKPLFTDKDPNTRLDSTDAKYVDVVHSCAGVLGSEDSLGTADFWPNGGSMSQPGCLMDFSGACSHGRSYEFFAESINPKKAPFQAYPCSDFTEFRKGRCLSNPVTMGDNVPKTAKGNYYLMTRDQKNYNFLQTDPNYGVTWTYFPDGDGNMQVAYLVYPNNNEEMHTKAFWGNKEILYYLYTQKTINNPKVFNMKDDSHKNILENNENFDPAKDTKIVIHGWRNNYTSPVGQMIKNAYLEFFDYNVIVVDWSSMSFDPLYVSSAYATRKVGNDTALLVDYLVTERQMDFNKIHIIGHSLGAQTAGFAGMNTKSGKVGRITGLDPAKPLFMNPDPDTHLDPTDGQFVDVIHSSAGLAGSDMVLGTADFWPNGGTDIQPGCNNIGSCSHERSYIYYAESINPQLKPFVAYPCSNYFEFLRGKCTENPTFMGNPTPTTAKGNYYLRTNSKSPYAM